MAYIRFNVKRTTDTEGNAVYAKIGRIESDMPSLSTNQSNIIWNALSKASQVKMWLKMDIGVLDRDMLAGAEYMLLDEGVLDCDLMT